MTSQIPPSSRRQPRCAARARNAPEQSHIRVRSLPLCQQRTARSPSPNSDPLPCRCSSRSSWTESRPSTRGRGARDQPELCSNLGENVTHTNCRKCFEGKGEMVQIVDPITGAVSAMDIDTPELPGGIDPTSFLFTVISISVLFQAIAFISLGTLGDYGDYRKRGWSAAVHRRGVAACMYVIVPADASLYWLGGVLMIVANVCLGVSVVFYNSYLPLMVDDSEEVRNAMAGGKEKGVESERDIIDAQEAVSSEYSSKGQMWGYVGGTTCLVLSVIALLVLVALGAEWFWALGVTSALSGAWWLGFSYFAFRRLPHRPGPPFPAAMNVYTEGWRKTYRLLALLWRTEVNTFYFLILFSYSPTDTARFRRLRYVCDHELCMDPMLLALIAIIVPLTAVFGGYAWLRFQRRFGWSSKSVLVLNLMLLALIPLWGCVGFFTEDYGLQTQGGCTCSRCGSACVWVPRRRSAARCFPS